MIFCSFLDSENDFETNDNRKEVVEKSDQNTDSTIKRPYCEVCNKNFHTNHFLQTHIKTFHQGTMQGKQCRICFRKFSAQSSLLNHLKIKHGVTKLTNEFTQTVPKGKSDLRF